ncbi:hypothetical protein AC578_6194 [Pseudocercospora eumusae]|uniref:Uncharacterized protein n=1 Tax=Pseudocercospora eumusae TaxID=321146 RepID=A0A139HA05_9PEZI|nr:hypothetical protein AC578_6194 [Pseudocercospora eumusae]
MGTARAQAYGIQYPWAASAPPVIEWESSFSPGFVVRAFAGVVCRTRQSSAVSYSDTPAHLGVLARLKERRDAHEADLVVPHDRVVLVGFARQGEGFKHRLFSEHSYGG